MRKILATALCAVVAMGYFMVSSSKSEPMSELMQANVKALAVNEDPEEGGGGGHPVVKLRIVPCYTYSGATGSECIYSSVTQAPECYKHYTCI